jgi:DNA (cytosine-5)-methyltransferase 1
MGILLAADLFCGGGGTTAGAESSGAVCVRFALNHWDIAIQTHSANFPHTRHVNSRLDQCNPSECDKIDLLFASPECTHHSRARGGRPTSDQQRAGAWDVLKWVEFHRPSWIVIENVIEFRDWGPVGNDGRPLRSKRGHFFFAWIKAIEAAGYKVDHRELNAADFEACTSRNRLFVVARKGNRQPIFPEPTHCRRPGNELPGLSLPRWRSAAEVIDWSISCPSIFGRKRQLAEKTLLRLEAGLRRFVGPYVVKFKGEQTCESIDNPLTTITAGGKSHGLAVPFSVQWDNHGSNGDRVKPIDDPLWTMHTKANIGLALPFITDVNHGSDGHLNGRTSKLENPFGTITARNGKALAMPFMLSTGSGGAPRSVDNPVPTIVSRDGTAIAIPWLSHFYGTNNVSPVTDPVDTITTKDRHSLCVALCRGPQDWPTPTTDAMKQLQATMRDLNVADLLFRMFQNSELAVAQGFESSYHFAGTKAEVTRQIGNSVSPPVAKAISLAIASV